MIYRYKAYTADNKMIKGTIESATQKLAEDSLYLAGFQRIIDLQQTNSGIDWKKLIKGPGKVTQETLLDFTTELSILTESGLTLLLALRQLEKQSTSGTLREVLAKLASDLQGGVPFHVALSMYPQVFSQEYCSVMEANEKAGTLDTGLKQLSKELKAQIALKTQIQRATTQPLIIVVLAIVVAILMAVVVLPPLADIFQQFGTELPLTAKVLIGFSNFVNTNFATLLVILGFVAIFLIVLIKHPSTKPVIDKYILDVPLIGQLIIWNNTGRFSRTLSNLLGAGILLPDGINIMLKGIGNSYIRNNLSEVRKKLVQGQSFSMVMANNKIFPPLLVEMIGVGEASGNLEFALGTVADYFETKVEKRITRLTSLIEPVLIIGIGLVVGFIAITMISTIYGLVGSIKA
jgi:type IV pilus assembly protein PilC